MHDLVWVHNKTKTATKSWMQLSVLTVIIQLWLWNKVKVTEPEAYGKSSVEVIIMLSLKEAALSAARKLKHPSVRYIWLNEHSLLSFTWTWMCQIITFYIYLLISSITEWKETKKSTHSNNAKRLKNKAEAANSTQGKETARSWIRPDWWIWCYVLPSTVVSVCVSYRD